MAGGKGIIVARALKRMGVPVVATGLAGGRNGRRILEELDRGGDPERLRPYRRRVADVDGGRSTRPRASYTEIIEWGPLARAEELEVLREKVDYLSRGAEMVVLRRLAAPRRRRRLLRRDDPRPQPARRGDGARLRGRAVAARTRGRAELVSPNQPEAEALVGQEFSDGRTSGLHSTRSARWADATSSSRTNGGCFALLRQERGAATRYRATIPTVEPVSRIGAGSVVLAGLIASRLDKVSAEDGLRRALAAGTASTLEVGAGQFELREAGRLAADVHVAELEPVPAER